MSDITYATKQIAVNPSDPQPNEIFTASDANEVKTAVNSKEDSVVGKGLSTEDYTTTEKTKLSGIQDGATANSSDSALLASAASAAASASKAASTITENSTHRFTTDAEKSTWNTKQDALPNVDNTSDVNKPVSTAQAAADAVVLSTAQSYADALVVGLLDDRGNYNASVNTFPSSGGSGTSGAILKGDIWVVSVAGTLGGSAVAIGDQIRALSNTPGQTSSNWAISEANIAYVPENSANKDQNSGYAGLNSSGFLNKTLDFITEGATNLYFTATRVLATALTGYTKASVNAALLTTDTISIGLGKLEKKSDDNTANIATNTTAISGKEPSITATTSADFYRGDKTFANFLSTVLGSVLTGLSLSTSSTISSTDTVLQAAGKLQAQVTNNTSNITTNTSNIASNTTAISGKESSTNKDATGGYAGLTLFKINFRDVANTFTSFFTNSNTAARTYTFQDRNGIIADDTDLSLKTDKLLSFVDKVASYVLVLTDAGKIVRINNGSANTLTIPPNTSVAFPIGTQILYYQQGVGQTTFTIGVGVTIISSGTKIKTSAQYSLVTLIKADTDTWLLGGDLI